MNVTKEDFESYEAVRDSGVTNMFAVEVVSNLSGLTRETILEIMDNYDVLSTKYAEAEASAYIAEHEE